MDDATAGAALDVLLAVAALLGALLVWSGIGAIIGAVYERVRRQR